MWRFAELSVAEQQPDQERFLESLNAQSSYFTASMPLWVARAPGRLDLMGGIADYSGSLVLELPLAAATWVAVQTDNRPVVTIRSSDMDESLGNAEVSLPLELLPADLDYTTAHQVLTADPQSAWAAYVAGALIVLQRERGLQLTRGLRIFIYSEVPAGKGVSSSAALEVASMQAMSDLYELEIAGHELALLCQRVENYIVGAPCGIMDQMTSACGQQDSLLALFCQPAQLQTAVTLPEELEVWGLDSGIRHAVSGADYGSVRVGAFMGYRIIADLAGLPIEQRQEGLVSIKDSIWQGYLANMAPSVWESHYRDRLPIQIAGRAFLEQYGGSTDPVTKIAPDRLYAVRQPAAHPIYENHRVHLFQALLTQAHTNEHFDLLGELMYQSHASYNACGLGSSGTDRIVEMVRQAGSRAGFYGAKITGGGSGGTVAVLARKGSRKQIEGIAEQYSRESGHPVAILGGSSAGAVAWGKHLLIE
ncbi:galactokinase [Tengunoibacter tsumagoiensis]|uniref:GHMP kinase n=1 Tax=Tengunoibacter tsumagoiensis TaxID=2014871 RepID=A0A402A3Y1_9CHLR|nr:galactokinase family protein [Tengunoibacter tsumagoiensis]GCE13756.1 hypothetical protein KTT_36150 [Tengunoibacter tsumagoiensis]